MKTRTWKKGISRVRRLGIANQLQYKGPRKLIEKQMRIFGHTLETEVWVWPDGRECWHGAVGAYGRVWIFRGIRNVLWLDDIQPFLGFYESGALKIDHKERAGMTSAYFYSEGEKHGT